MQIYGNVRKRLHKKRGQLPQDWFATHQHGRRVIVLEHRYGRRDGNYLPTVRALIGYFEFT